MSVPVRDGTLMDPVTECIPKLVLMLGLVAFGSLLFYYCIIE